jgi:hypothetical protein
MTLQIRLFVLALGAGGALAACGGGGGSSTPSAPGVRPTDSPTPKQTLPPSPTPSPSPTPTASPTPSPTPPTVTVSPSSLTFTGPSTPGNVAVSGGVPPYTFNENFCVAQSIAEITATPPPSQNPAVYEVSYGTSLGTCQITFTDSSAKKSSTVLNVTNDYNPH